MSDQQQTEPTMDDDGPEPTTWSSRLEDAGAWIIGLGALALWEVACRVFEVPRFVLPTPSAIAESFWTWKGVIGVHAMQTLYTTVVGFVFAVIGGVLLGIAVGTSKMLYKSLYPLLIGFNSVPKVAIVPILVIWFGIGTIPAVISAFMLSFFPIVVNVATGLATLEPELQDVLRSLGASRRDILLKVGLPRSMPYLFAALKVAITLALVGSVIAETIGSNAGIGYLMLNASGRFDVPLVFAGLFVVAIMGVLIYAAFAKLEARLTGWATRDVTPAAGS
jgi:NitT/TauT family transport system permease protein